MIKPGNLDERREPLYDTLTVVKQTTVKSGTKLFTAGTDGKTLNKTNVGGNSELPAPERHDVYGIRIAFADTPAADIKGLCKALVGRLIVTGKAQITAPLTYFPAGGAQGANGVEDARAVMQFPDGYHIPIEAGEKFFFELVGEDYLLTDVTTGLFMQVLLDGFHSVPVN